MILFAISFAAYLIAFLVRAHRIGLIFSIILSTLPLLQKYSKLEMTVVVHEW